MLNPIGVERVYCFYFLSSLLNVCSSDVLADVGQGVARSFDCNGSSQEFRLNWSLQQEMEPAWWFPRKGRDEAEAEPPAFSRPYTQVEDGGHGGAEPDSAWQSTDRIQRRDPANVR